MPDGQQVITQADFSAGAFPGLEDIPANGVEDIVDGLLLDDAAIARRGNYTALADAVASVNGYVVADVYMPAVGARRTVQVVQDSAGSRTTTMYAVNGSNVQTKVTEMVTTARGVGRPVVAGGMLLAPVLSTGGLGQTVLVYGGAQRFLQYTTGRVTVMQNSATATFSGGANLTTATAAAGDIVKVNCGDGDRAAVIKSVDSATQVTLLDPWPGLDQTAVTYAIQSATYVAVADVHSTAPVRLAVQGGRVLVGQGETIRESSLQQHGTDAAAVLLSDWLHFSDDDVQRVNGASMLGLESLGSEVLAFTTDGLRDLSGAAFRIVDDFGNPQQALQPISRELVLWGDRGIAQWQGAAVVPALDDLYLVAPGRIQAIGGGARKLYVSYVRAGYVPGQAAVFRGHYMLPILDLSGSSDATVDVLVWRLDRLAPIGAPFVRWQDDLGTRLRGLTVGVSVSEQASAPRLLGLLDSAIVDMTSVFAYETVADAFYQLLVTTRSYMVSETVEHTLRRARIRYELDDSATNDPTITAEVATGRPGSAFTTIDGTWATEDRTTFTWSFAKKAQQTRMRFTSNNPASKCVLRAIEAHVRPHGRT